MDWTTLLVAVAGLLATLAAPPIQTWLAARNERTAWRRDAQVAVYADALSYVEVLSVSVERLTDLYRDIRWTRPQVPHRDLITSRMRLLAPRDTFDKWKTLITQEDIFDFNVNENYSDDPRWALPDDDADLVKLRSAITDVNEAIYRSFWKD